MSNEQEPIKGKQADEDLIRTANESKFYPDEPWPQEMFNKAADAPEPTEPTAAGTAFGAMAAQPPPPDDPDEPIDK